MAREIAAIINGGGNPALDAFKAEIKREDGESLDITARKLLDIFSEVTRPHPFKAGDLVVPRAYSPYSLPMRGRPGIIVKVLDAPVLDPEASAGDASYRRELDVIVGCMRGGQFLMFHQASIYLEPYRGEIA